MKRFVGNEWVMGPALGVLTFLAVGITGTGTIGAYLFGMGFVTIALLIKRHQEPSP